MPRNGRKWTYRKLGEEYGLHWTRIMEIIKNNEHKYAPKLLFDKTK